MLDRDLALLYQVETKALNQQVKRNTERFPESFSFVLTEEETKYLRSHFVTANISPKARVMPRAFTEHGVLMLSNVLKSERAVKMSIYIIEIFVKIREIVLSNKEVMLKLEQLERKFERHDGNIEELYQVVKGIMHQKEQARTAIGFKTQKKK